ncbi:UvrD-helicase domain-containing protein [Noviherbaspirillum sp. CPCC 100848]|uniref:DNA 3'-5' helicase n=1 Tax=Noviherbaspirillum album TaxID=3080276 RepID=A0ABU6J9R3_9BURK|nr:UvrD-helicase domain-containing protein [Noviherbaspirillum sp. CPCC 100848]MEC4720395.1 UvrD-helicase domain-containing protein [Noviherbaspirillum sp. CPCC 100848]
MNQIELTTEQAGPRDSNALNLVINAFAGSGKTTTLRAYAVARPMSSMLYVAFNKVTADEAAASFPRNVECRTMHSLAFTAVGKQYKHKLAQLRPNVVANSYKEKGVTVLTAHYLVKTVEAFMYSADLAIRDSHVPQEVPAASRSHIAKGAQYLWNDMVDAKSTMPMTHDGYLKLFQLSKPVLSNRYDVILLDEAQDTNPVTMDIVFRQSCGKVIVGDKHQSIYAFRGCVNAMEMLKNAESHYLTQSMRFGAAVAEPATLLLRFLKGESRAVIGLGQMDALPNKVDRSQPYTVICRTNAKVFGHAVRLLGEKKVHFVGGVESYPLGKLEDVFHMWNGEKSRVKDAFYREFADCEALEAYARETDEKEILSLISVAREFKSDLPALIAQVKAAACEKLEDADVILTTAHRSKGLQFRQVVLNDDFDDLVDGTGKLNIGDFEKFQQEVNLLYVAMTRAQRAIELNTQFNDFAAAVRAGDVDPIGASSKTGKNEKVATQTASAASSHAVGLSLAEKIGKMILRIGPLSCQAMGERMDLSEETVAAEVVRMISNGDLSSLYFVADGLVQAKLKAQGYRSPEMAM